MKIYSFIFRLLLQLIGKWSDAGTYEGIGIIGFWVWGCGGQGGW